MSARAVSAAIVALLACGTARAENLAPKVTHHPITQVKPGEKVVVRATITSRSGKPIYDPTVFVRASGEMGFGRVSLHPDPKHPGTYTAAIPAAITGSDFDYYIEAFDTDGNGPGRAGSPDAPFHVKVVAPVPVARKAPRTKVPDLTSPPRVQHIVLSAPPPARTRSQAPTVILSVAGGLVLAAGIASTALYYTERNNLADAVRNHTEFDSSAYHTGQMAALGGSVLIPVSGLLLGGGIAYMAWPYPKQKAAAQEQHP